MGDLRDRRNAMRGTMTGKINSLAHLRRHGICKSCSVRPTSTPPVCLDSRELDTGSGEQPNGCAGHFVVPGRCSDRRLVGPADLITFGLSFGLTNTTVS